MYTEVRNKLIQSHPKSRTKSIHDDELEALYPGTKYKKALLIYWICKNETYQELPTAYCGREPKYDKGTMKNVCSHFNLKDKTSCEMCHKEYFKYKNEKNREGNFLKYGVSNPMKDINIVSKLKKTNNERYGTDWGLSNKTVQNKIQKTRNAQKVETRTNLVHMNIEGKYILLDKITTGDYLSVHNFHCIKGNHDFTFKFSNNYDCIRCTVCEPRVNTGEDAICNFLDSIGVRYIKSDRKLLNGKEIDIYIPSHKIGIEYNGMYWHSTKYLDKMYHQNKTLLAKNEGIRLVHIFENQFNENPELIFRRLRALLGTTDRIYARKCEVREISSSESSMFIQKYHSQGSINSSINIGTFYKNELVAVMSVGKSRFSKKYQYELYRYCSKGTVIGAVGKMLQYFERTYKPKSIHTYAEIDWGSGEVYTKVGFEYIGMTVPNYVYYNPNSKKTYSRQQCQKHKLLQQYPQYANNTETEIMESLGYLKVYNSGNSQFIKIY